MKKKRKKATWKAVRFTTGTGFQKWGNSAPEAEYPNERGKNHFA